MHCTGKMKYFKPAQKAKGSEDGQKESKKELGNCSPASCTQLMETILGTLSKKITRELAKDNQTASICFLDDPQITTYPEPEWQG